MAEVLDKMDSGVQKIETEKFEKINTSTHSNSDAGSLYVARKIAELIVDKAAGGEYAILGLATGSSPTKVYDNLIRFHQTEGLSFKNVITFNLDEYYPMEPEDLQSYVRFMHEHLFNHVDIEKKNIHIPDGTLPIDTVKSSCSDYELKIQKLGGIDIQLLGIGRTGHIGFNEPGSSISSSTRLIRLDKVTRLDAASDFFGYENVPARAITMGINSIMLAKKVFLIAWGEGKANVVRDAVEGEINALLPASFLQKHPDCNFILDSAASNELTRVKTPWLVEDCKWTERLITKATIWLATKLDKAILKLTNEDYNEYGMGSLIAEFGLAEEINLRVFNNLQHTITGWPGGKPDVDDSTRPERANPFPKISMIFSPHPDDDVISMGGTLMRLVDQGHDVHVAYQTSGNIAVFDDDVIRFLDFTKNVIESDGSNAQLSTVIDGVKESIDNKISGMVDAPEVQNFKGLIRQGEARSACRYCGLKEKNVHFLNLPFYETGTIRKKPSGEEDVQIIYDLLCETKPEQVFAAGDLSDPHGTHQVCLDVIFKAINRLKEEEQEWIRDLRVWLYRGAWQEWEVSDIEMAVPIGPRDLLRKRNAIFKHQSQKDEAMFPGNDKREFWQRAEDRNRETASAYNKLGLSEYEAIEAFVQWKF